MKKILKSAREEQLVTYKGTLIRFTANFSIETTEATRQWMAYSRCGKKKLSSKALISRKSISEKGR